MNSESKKLAILNKTRNLAHRFFMKKIDELIKERNITSNQDEKRRLHREIETNLLKDRQMLNANLAAILKLNL